MAIDNTKSNYALAVSYMVQDLIAAYAQAGDNLNFTKLKGTAAKKYKLLGTSQNVGHTPSHPAGMAKQVCTPFAKRSRSVRLRVSPWWQSMSKPHRCPHIAMTGNVVRALVQEDRTVTLNTAHKPTRGTKPPSVDAGHPR
jgi:hypothetical protein